jgi:hypothetical protein
MTVKVRMSGEPDQIAAVVALLREKCETAGGDRAYPNRGSFGVRVYLEIRPNSTTNQTTTGNPRRKS